MSTNPGAIRTATLPSPKPPAAANLANQTPAAESLEFYPIPYTAPLQPYERVTVVQSNVPVRALIAAGFQLPRSRTNLAETKG